MSIEVVFYMSLILFFISLLGLLISSGFIPVFISLQVLMVSAIVNFLNFSLRVVPQDTGIKMLIVLGFLTFYLLEFSLVYYIYSNGGNRKRGKLADGFRLISFEKNDWWGEDRT